MQLSIISRPYGARIDVGSHCTPLTTRYKTKSTHQGWLIFCHGLYSLFSSPEDATVALPNVGSLVPVSYFSW